MTQLAQDFLLSYWFIAIVSLVVLAPLVWRWLISKRRIRRHLCIACAYSLRGLRDACCPECGLEQSRESLRNRRRHAIRRGIAAFVLASIVITVGRASGVVWKDGPWALWPTWTLPSVHDYVCDDRRYVVRAWVRGIHDEWFERIYFSSVDQKRIFLNKAVDEWLPDERASRRELAIQTIFTLYDHLTREQADRAAINLVSIDDRNVYVHWDKGFVAVLLPMMSEDRRVATFDHIKSRYLRHPGHRELPLFLQQAMEDDELRRAAGGLAVGLRSQDPMVFEAALSKLYEREGYVRQPSIVDAMVEQLVVGDHARRESLIVLLAGVHWDSRRLVADKILELAMARTAKNLESRDLNAIYHRLHLR